MTPPESTDCRDALAAAHADGLPGLGRLRRAWPADLDDPAAGVVAELVGADGTLLGARWRQGRWRVVDDRRRLPGLAELSPLARVVSLRPRKRLVARVPDGAFAKLARSATTARAAATLATVDALLSKVTGAPRRPAKRSVDAARGVLVLEPVPGAALTDLLDAGPVGSGAAGPASVARDIAACLVAMSRVRPARRDDDRLPVHDLTDEAVVLRRWASSALALAPLSVTDRARLTQQARRVADRLAACEPGDRILVHRDLHDGQMLLTSEDDGDGTVGDGARFEVTVLDWDTAAWGDPVIDVANLLAHLDRAATPWAQALTSSLVTELRRAGHPALDPRQADRLLLAREATRLRLVAVHAFRPPGRGASSHAFATSAH